MCYDTCDSVTGNSYLFIHSNVAFNKLNIDQVILKDERGSTCVTVIVCIQCTADVEIDTIIDTPRIVSEPCLKAATLSILLSSDLCKLWQFRSGRDYFVLQTNRLGKQILVLGLSLRRSTY